jgi:hypothetical protein
MTGTYGFAPKLTRPKPIARRLNSRLVAAGDGANAIALRINCGITRANPLFRREENKTARGPP